MKFKSFGLAILLTAIVGSAFAQNKFSGNGKCGEKPDASQSTEVEKKCKPRPPATQTLMFMGRDPDAFGISQELTFTNEKQAVTA